MVGLPGSQGRPGLLSGFEDISKRGPILKVYIKQTDTFNQINIQCNITDIHKMIDYGFIDTPVNSVCSSHVVG